MNRSIRVLAAWSLALMIGLLGPSALLSRASAAGPLPTFKAASPARFDLTGMISVGPSIRKLQATGAQSGDQFQQDMVITQSPGSPVTFNSIQIGSMYYFKLTGNDQWQSIDLSKTPGNVPTIKSDIPGLNGFNPNGGQRTYEAANSSQEAGKETINGVATTRYQAGVDLVKLYTSIGTPAAQAAQVAAVSNMTLYLWVGDSDQVLYQQRVILNSKTPGPGGTLLDVIVDFMITYHDLGTAVTISAPANSVPYAPQAPAPAPAPASPPASQPNAADVVRAFVDAYNRGDITALRALVAPGTRFVTNPGTPAARDQSFEEFTTPPLVHVTIDNLEQPAPDTVVIDITLSGGDIPTLPHPFTSKTTFKVVSGQITSFLDMVSAQTSQDLAALGPQPGMPKTGQSLPVMPLAALVLSLLCIAVGVRARRNATI